MYKRYVYQTTYFTTPRLGFLLYFLPHRNEIIAFLRIIVKKQTFIYVIYREKEINMRVVKLI